MIHFILKIAMEVLNLSIVVSFSTSAAAFCYSVCTWTESTFPRNKFELNVIWANSRSPVS